MGLRRAGIDGIERTGDTLRIGAMTTLTALADQAHAPLLATAARRTGSWAIRNMATVGGNLFTPSPGGDVGTALLALDATVEVTGAQGTRSIPLAGVLDGLHGHGHPGRTSSSPRSRVDLTAGSDTFLKLGRREANTPAVVMVAAHARGGRWGRQWRPGRPRRRRAAPAPRAVASRPRSWARR